MNNSLKPETIYSGNKIMMMKVRKFGIRFIDSLNFIPQPLKAFTKTFGLSELKKGYFPHYFNKPCNRDYVGPLPPKRHYGVNQMRSKGVFTVVRPKEKLFDMRKELIEYCQSDVDILRHSCLQFRESFIKIANIDPFQYATIASVCMAIFRDKFLKPDTIAVIKQYGEV